MNKNWPKSEFHKQNHFEGKTFYPSIFVAVTLVRKNSDKSSLTINPESLLQEFFYGSIYMDLLFILWTFLKTMPDLNRFPDYTVQPRHTINGKMEEK